MLDFEIQATLSELLAPITTYQDEEVDALMLEIKNFKNVNNLLPHQLLSNALTVMLNRCPFHKHQDVTEWPLVIAKAFKPLHRFWSYTKLITDDDDRSECVFHVWDYCQNIKRPHLAGGFGYIISSLMAGDIICPVATAKFIEACENSDLPEENSAARELVPFVSMSCPW